MRDCRLCTRKVAGYLNIDTSDFHRYRYGRQTVYRAEKLGDMVNGLCGSSMEVGFSSSPKRHWKYCGPAKKIWNARYGRYSSPPHLKKYTAKRKAPRLLKPTNGVGRFVFVRGYRNFLRQYLDFVIKLFTFSLTNVTWSLSKLDFGENNPCATKEI